MTTRSCPVSKLDNLLIATDCSEFSEGAVTEAIKFAKLCSSNITVLTVIESTPEQKTGILPSYEAEAARYLEGIKAKAREDMLPCEVLVLHGNDPTRLIVGEATRRKSDMIIIGKHGQVGASSNLIGEVTKKVIGDAPCKVLVVPKAASIFYKEILMATDGSSHSDAALSEVMRIAKRCGSRLIVVSVVESEDDIEKAKVIVGDASLMAEKSEVEVLTMTPSGKAHVVISEIASSRGVDLIVMGTYRKTGLRKLFMGSTTEKVVGASGCAVMIVQSW